MSLFQPFLFIFSDDPVFRVIQVALLLLGSLAVFLVFFATRDIFLRTESALYQLACILIVALLPIIGFLIYLLIRPARTLKEKEVEEMLREVLGKATSRETRSQKPETNSDSPK